MIPFVRNVLKIQIHRDREVSGCVLPREVGEKWEMVTNGYEVYFCGYGCTTQGTCSKPLHCTLCVAFELYLNKAIKIFKK